MDNVHLMAVPDGIDDDFHIWPVYHFFLLDFSFWEADALSYSFVQFSSFHEFEYEYDAGLFFEDFVDVDDVWVI